jgi:hypothetical protein
VFRSVFQSFKNSLVFRFRFGTNVWRDDRISTGGWGCGVYNNSEATIAVIQVRSEELMLGLNFFIEQRIFF